MKIGHLVKLLVKKGSFALLLLIFSGYAFGADLPEQAQNGLSRANPRVQEVMAAQEEAIPELMGMQDVIGTAVGLDDNGELVIHVYVNTEGVNPGESARNIPRNIRGENTKVILTDPFRALRKPAPVVSTVSHTAKQTPPIQLGTSGGWAYDLANGYCCGGTLGSLVSVGGAQYILSNYHVFEADIVDGGNGTTAVTGDSIIQPGLIDVGCNNVKAQDVASLRSISSLPGANVDASIAQVIPGQVDNTGAILEIGTISSQTMEASITQPVKKSGRTTGLTSSSVSGLNANVIVSYDDECAGAEAFTKTFIGQILIKNRGSKFLAGGDSGSLMVENVSSNPRSIGLLFAGSSTLAVANPIDEVLSYLGGTMVGK